MANKKFTNEEAVAKIKVLTNQFYGNVGRNDFEDIDIERKDLLEEIDEIINKTDISAKHLVVEQLKLEEEDE